MGGGVALPLATAFQGLPLGGWGATGLGAFPEGLKGSCLGLPMAGA